jgi:hypothetical protein
MSHDMQGQGGQRVIQSDVDSGGRAEGRIL